MRNNIFKLILMMMLIFSFSGCSLIKMATQPFKNTVSKVPEAIEKSERRIRCKGEIIIDKDGRVEKCTEQYYSDEKNFSQKERKLTMREKISQFILNVKGYILWIIIIGIVLSLSGCGWIVGAIFSGVRGVGRVAKDLVHGISKGKKYVRQNGDKYTETERKVYQQALDDLMNRIDNSLSNKESRKIVNKLRAETYND